VVILCEFRANPGPVSGTMVKGRRRRPRPTGAGVGSEQEVLDGRTRTKYCTGLKRPVGGAYSCGTQMLVDIVAALQMGSGSQL
jgi:hypothetical protein